MLKDAVQAIYNKVATDLTNASPEELAYLSTSLEKLGGRATVYDVMDVGEDKKTEIQTLANQIIANMNTDVADKVAQFNIDVQAIVNLQTQNFNTMIANTTSEYNTLVQTTSASLDLLIQSAETSVSNAEADIASAAAALTGAAAIANQQAMNGSAFNLYLYGTMQV
jgi:hypothetical protein